MKSILITIDDDNVVYLEGLDEDNELVLLQRLESTLLEVRDMRDRKADKRRWWSK